MKLKGDLKRILFTIIPILIFFVLLLEKIPTFVANDDVYIMKVLSGKITGVPYYETAFFSSILGFILSTLYKVIYFPWFTLLLIFITLFAQCYVMNKLYHAICNDNISKFISIIISICFLCFFLYSDRYITYTTVASISGGLSIIFLNEFFEKNNSFKIYISIMLLSLAVMIRSLSGFVAGLFWGLYYLYLVIEHREYIKHIKIIFTAFVIVSLLFGFDMLVKHKLGEPEDYYKFMQAQADFNDYQHINPNSEEMEELITKIGWDRNLYNLAKGYFSMDDRLEVNDYLEFKNHLKNSKFSISQIKSNLFDYDILYLKYNAYIFILFFAILYLHLMRKNKVNIKRDILFLCILSIVNVVLIGYLGYKGRVVLRGIYAVTIPCLFLLISLFLRINNKQYNFRKIKNKKIDIIFIIAMSILCVLIEFNIIRFCIIIFILYMLRNIIVRKYKFIITSFACIVICLYSYKSFYFDLFGDGMRKLTDYGVSLSNEVENYVLDNKDKIIIADLAYNLDFRIFMNNKKVSNLIYAGGTNVKSKVFNDQLKLNGIDKYNCTLFLKDNVVFLDRNNKISMYEGLFKNYGINGKFELVDKKGNINVYKFREAK